MKLTSIKRNVTWMLLMVFTLGVSLQAQAAPQSMISTEQLLNDMRLAEQRDTVQGFLNRDDVQQQLTQRGVDAADAQARVAAMNAAELAELSAHIDDLPAGEGLLETVLFLLVIFMLLDVAGVTDIFPGI